MPDIFQRIRQLYRVALIYTVLGIASTIAVAWTSAAFVDVMASPQQTITGSENDAVWNIERWQHPCATYVVSNMQRYLPWSAAQTTGAPDSPGAGDQATAWASKTEDSQREWLILTYEQALLPVAVLIYENYCPGAVDRVTIFDANDKETEAWQGTDPTPKSAGSGVSRILLNVDKPTSKIKLYINSPAVKGWNEIDAVGLVDKAGRIFWAVGATASSTYATPPAGAVTFENASLLIPSWGGINIPTSFDATRNNTLRAIDGRGWPAIALWCERDSATGVAIAGALGVKKPQSTGPAQAKLGFYTTVANPGASLGMALPYRIAWRGFLLDVAFFAIALALLRLMFTAPLRLVREVSRLRHGQCIKCGYDIAYNFPAGCPECGWRRTSEASRH